MMANKKNEDLEKMRTADNDFGEEKDPFLARTASVSHRARQAQDANMSRYMAKVEHSPGASILAYCFSSISMTVVNKYVVSGSSWNLNFFYLAVQSIVCIVAIMVCKQFSMINIAPFDSTKAKKWFPISLVFVGMIFTSTKALQFLSVPVYTIFKNLTIIVIAYGEVLWFGGSVSSVALLSFGLMVLSSVIAAWADIQAAISGVGPSPEASVALSTLNAGYAWMGLNVFCTASYLLGMRKVIKKLNFKDWDTMFYNNLLTIPVLVTFSLITEDWSVDNLAQNFPPESRNGLLMGMVYSGLAAIFISYCSAWCIRVTSSTTYSMVGALNKLPIAISGLVFFDAPITFGSVSAIVIGFVSGLIFAWAKIRQTEQKSSVLPTVQPTMSASSQSNRDAANS